MRAVIPTSAGVAGGAVCDQIRTVDKSRLKKQLGQLSIHDLSAIEDGLKQVLCL